MKRSETKNQLKSSDYKKFRTDEKNDNISTKLKNKKNDNIRSKIYKAIRHKKLDHLEYTYFNRHQFIDYLYMMSDGGNSFDEIDQGTVNSLNMILRENNTYIEFAASHAQDWVVTDGVMYAFEYLFKCKREHI
jgi:hypothetical protein